MTHTKGFLFWYRLVVFLGCLFVRNYFNFMYEKWEIYPCSWAFNQFTHQSFAMMTLIHHYQLLVNILYQTRTIETIVALKCHKYLMLGILLPIFTMHTIFGWYSFFTANFYCNKYYKGRCYYKY